MDHLHIRAAALRMIRDFHAARSGAVVILFALSIIPLLFAAGAAIDYARYSAAKARLDANLDAAILGIVSQNSNTIGSDHIKAVERAFRDEAATLTGVEITGFQANSTMTATVVTLTASYTAEVETTLARLMRVDSLTAKGTASAERKLGQYVDFYLLLDNSPSMGLAATTADIAKLSRLTEDGCAFACHDPSVSPDNYTIAMKNKVKLRIHVLRDAVVNLVASAKSAMWLPNQYRMEIWTFSDTPVRLSPLSPNLDQVKLNAGKIDMVVTNYMDNQTSYERALPRMTSVIPPSQDGRTPAKPIRFLFFVTDGVQDTPVDGTVSNPKDGAFDGPNRFMSPINPALCQRLKDNGVRIGIIYTTYLPLYMDDWYNEYIRPFERKIPTALEACASKGLFFPVSTDGDINAAMQTLFTTAVAQIRITN